MRDGVPFQTGDIVAGRYRVEALLGKGGFGVVYRAVQLTIGRAVALKMLLAEALAHADGIARFRREAELAQRLEHPNTVRLYDFGEAEGGLPFTAWELLRGRPLDAVIGADGPLATPRVARIAAQVLKALMEAHGLGIVHRDVKPSNIFLCEFSGEHDFVKVLDFGIAKSLSAGPGLTRDGAILGTPSYMSPEQVAGEEVTPAADLYALGLVMAEALSGRPVFTGDSGLAVCMAQLSKAPPPLPPSVLSSPLASVITRATHKAPAARFPSAGEMLAQLEAVALTLSSSTPAASLPVNVSPPSVAPPSVAPAPAAKPLAQPPLAQPPFAPAPVTMPPALSPGAPAPASARRPAIIAMVVAGVVTLAAVAVIIDGRTDAPLLERARGGRARSALGPPVGHHFAQLSAAQIRARIEDANHRVGMESTTDPVTTWLLGEHLDATNMVQLYRYPDALRADAVQRAWKSKGSATARDGNAVLAVTLAQPGAAEVLLNRILR